MAKTQEDQAGEIATRDAGGMAAIEPTAELVRMAYDAIQNGTLPPEVGDPNVTQRLILQRIRQGTFEQSLEPTSGLVSLREWIDRPAIYQGFHFNPSSFRGNEDNASPSSVYAVIEVADLETGEAETVQFGGVNVLMQLVKAWEERKFPFVATLVGSKTGQGYTTFWLRDPDKVAAGA